MGADAVLANIAITAVRDPIHMAKAFKTAVECAREAFKAGLPSSSITPEAASPLAVFFSESSVRGDASYRF